MKNHGDASFAHYPDYPSILGSVHCNGQPIARVVTHRSGSPVELGVNRMTTRSRNFYGNAPPRGSILVPATVGKCDKRYQNETHGGGFRGRRWPGEKSTHTTEGVGRARNPCTSDALPMRLTLHVLRPIRRGTLPSGTRASAPLDTRLANVAGEPAWHSAQDYRV